MMESEAIELVRQYAAEIGVEIQGRISVTREPWSRMAPVRFYHIDVFSRDQRSASASVNAQSAEVAWFEWDSAVDSERLLPPWLVAPHYSAVTIGWRMGRGEDYWIRWHEWHDHLSPESKSRYRQRFPEPEFDAWPGFYDRVAAVRGLGGKT